MNMVSVQLVAVSEVLYFLLLIICHFQISIKLSVSTMRTVALKVRKKTQQM